MTRTRPRRLGIAANASSAMGCLPELPEGLVARATVFCDDSGQACELGELQWAPQVRSVELGDLITGKARFSRGSQEITLFDMTGLALQDMTVARQIFQKATAVGGRPRRAVALVIDRRTSVAQAPHSAPDLATVGLTSTVRRARIALTCRAQATRAHGDLNRTSGANSERAT
jgi:hypothetical protein